MSDRTELAFFVMKGQTGWIVRAEGAFYGPYLSLADAITGAISEAQAAGLCGFASVVLARPETESTFDVRWTYGLDAYPLIEADQLGHRRALSPWPARE